MKKLLVVATRGSAEKGKMPEDEYCAQWGLPGDEKFKWCITAKVALLVLHGHGKADLKDVVEDAAKNNAKDRPDIRAFEGDALFYHHSLKESDDVADINRKISDSFSIKQVQAIPYRSGGGVAIEELIRDIRQNQPKVYREDLIEAIERAAAGRMIFVSKLRNIQSTLIRLRLLLEVGESQKREPGTIDPYLTEQLRDTERLFKMATEGSRGRFRGWLDLIETSGAEQELKAIKVLSCPGGGAMPEDISAKEAWKGLGDPRTFVQKGLSDLNSIALDIRLFARAADVLLEASEHYPHTLPESKKKPKKAST